MSPTVHGTQTPLGLLAARMDEAAAPVADAFAARLRAIDPSLQDERDEQAVAMVLADLRDCIASGPNAEQLVTLATAVARRIGGKATALVRYRHAIQALDWALRDLFIDGFRPEQRVAFARTTNLFIELVRHVLPAVTSEHVLPSSTSTTHAKELH